MTWVRWGDTASHDSIVMAPLDFDEYDERLVNEINGFANRCASASGRENSDYVVTKGVARDIAGVNRFPIIMPLAIRAGYFMAPPADTDACDAEDASSAQRTLPDAASGTADPGQPEAATPATSTDGVSADIRGNQQPPTGGQGTDSVCSGRDGSGRDGSGQDGRTAPSGAGRDDPPRSDAAVPRSRRRGGRRRNPPPPTISPEPGM